MQVKKDEDEAGEMAQWLKSLAAAAAAISEDPGLDPTPTLVAHSYL